jgi:hypothetical protein
VSDVTFAQVVSHCGALGLPHQVHEGDNLVLVGMPGQQGTYLVGFRLWEERAALVARAGRVLTVPSERRAALAQAACHINARILLGAFCLDLEEGALSLELAVPYDGVGLSAAQVERCLAAIGWTLDTYLPTLQRLCWTPETAEEALGLAGVSPLQAMLDALPGSEPPLPQSA